ncbi:bicaudal D-related protein homolog [Limulus polyphemus]|uniref:Bicaudal D-related protein homolog n=1 Tax=Limulus polyphemus TaxID=6850 RepID=A0ABM1T776_LIMPO|nr:bicaudal D-related protein homolog [Limulus polyphemus]
MCACRLQEMQQTSNYNNLNGNLEDYLRNSESRSTKFNGENHDVHSQLTQKENDIILAAQLGKALLENNDELSRENERLTEEYSFILEELEQEKYSLRRKLDALEGEYDTRVADLQTELNELRKELDEHKKFIKSTEMEKYQIVQELQDENQRLTEVLNQIDMLMEEKSELERRIQELVKEQERLNLSLEDSSNQILILENNKKEQEEQCDWSKQFTHSSMGFHDDMDEDDELSPCTGLTLPASEENWKFRQELVDIYHQLRRVCEDLKRRKATLSKDNGNPPSPDDIQVHEMRIGTITGVLQELKLLLQDLFVNHTKSISVQEAELTALKEERDCLRDDMGNTGMGKDEVVKKACDVRDKAVSRKNAVEIELAKTRIDAMHISSQLMEAIKQKVELSQQVEQWQDDMQSLLDGQLKAKLHYYEQVEKSQTLSTVPQKKRDKLFKLWT